MSLPLTASVKLSQLEQASSRHACRGLDRGPMLDIPPSSVLTPRSRNFEEIILGVINNYGVPLRLRYFWVSVPVSELVMP